MTVVLRVLALSLIPGIAWAQSDAPNPVDALLRGLSRVVTSITSPQAGELASRLDKGDLTSADSFYESERKYFQEHPEHQALIKKLADAINAQQVPAINAHIAALQGVK